LLGEDKCVVRSALPRVLQFCLQVKEHGLVANKTKQHVRSDGDMG